MTPDGHEIGDVVVMMLDANHDNPITTRVRFNKCYEVCYVEEYEKIRDDIYDDLPLQKEDEDSMMHLGSTFDDSHQPSTGVLTIHQGEYSCAFDNLQGAIVTLVPFSSIHVLNSASMGRPPTRVRCCNVT